jgi:hypothetical protein
MSNAARFLSVLKPNEFTDLVRQKSPWLTPAQAAAYLRLSVRVLEVWRAAGTGPEYNKRGRFIRYHIDVLDAWVAAVDQ